MAEPTQLARISDSPPPVLAAELESMREQAMLLIKSGTLPVALNTPEKVIAVALAGREMGIGMQQAVRGLHVVNGRVGASTGLLLGFAYRRIPGFWFKVKETTNEACTVEAGRSGGTEATATFTIKDATRAALTGDAWRKYPADMLFNRATSRVLRMVAPDAIFGMYGAEEIEPIESRGGATTALVGETTEVVDAIPVKEDNGE